MLTDLRAARGILFDFNGTLSDDETELAAAYGQALLDLGLPAMTPGEYESLLGMSEPDIAAALVSRRGQPHLATRLLDEVCARYVALCAQRPRVSDATVSFVRDLKQRGLRVGIVTGTLRQLIEPVLAERGLAPLLDALVTVEDVAAGKPDPEGFLRGAELLGLNPAEIVVFEDSPAGVRAAHAAGMSTIGIGQAAGCTPCYPTMDAAVAALS
ncbi:HAD family phosphatase [Corynebacterium sp.]|uniref:HAD family hydrolase n=1 Tax=Corynebacterium sp. TaxID=1720 RepID=UPI0026E057D5|nr:HAD family phosphatase [Corynebacterium sp.]MDO5512542.1 HAD family phosphatase [Corynebacterium sp.]